MVILLYLAGGVSFSIFLYCAFLSATNMISGADVNPALVFAVAMLFFFICAGSFRAADTLRKKKGMKGHASASELRDLSMNTPVQPPSRSENWGTVIGGIIIFGLLVAYEGGYLDRFFS